MRNLSANALAKIATTHGNEPITIVEIDWIEDEGSKLYADRTTGAIRGKILEVGNLDNVISVSNNDSSQELSLTLDDTDGTIKAILDTNDIHKRSARVYQWFEGLGLDDRFLLFAGKISSPIKWSERDRTVSFTIISQLEDKEVGFSAEEGQFPWIPSGILDKAWPMIFGKVQDVPAMQFNQAVSGRTICGIGIVSGESQHYGAPLGGNDSAFYVSMTQMSAQASHLWHCWSASCDEDEKEAFSDQANAVGDQMSQMSFDHQKQKECARLQRILTYEESVSAAGGNALGCNPVRILGGEDFPQNVGLKISIGQGVFTGYFDGDEFHISDRIHVVNEAKAEETSNRTWTYWRAWREHHELCGPTPPFAEWKFETQLKCIDWPSNILFPDGIIKDSGSASGTLSEDETDKKADQLLQHYWAASGSSVSLWSIEEITYLISIIPGTVLTLKAYKVLDNERLLVNIPTELYEISIVDYGPIQTVQAVFSKPLSTITGQGWDDTIYVTFESDVGPHTCDILEYIITNYTDLSFDATSFTNIRANLDPFPMNFPILEKKTALTVLQEIAFQARCALWISNGVFYIKYLPEEPSSDATITVSDIDAERGIEVELSSTEDLVTRMNVDWRISWNEDDPNRVILRHNVKKYGTQTEDYFFYCFNQPDIVLKAATFWLVRNANTWKKIKFKTYLQMLNLETFDTVTLDFGSQDYVSTSPVKAIVEEATYNSDDQTIDFSCHTPVRSGEMVEYEFFWPAALTVDDTYPTDEDVADGYAGGDGIGVGATGDLPIGFTDPDDWGSGIVWVGGPNVVFSGPADHGESVITDVGFVAQTISFSNVYAELDTTSVPNPDLQESYALDTNLFELQPIAQGIMIDLHETIIVDNGKNKEFSNSPRRSNLGTFFRGINNDSADRKLLVDTDEALWSSEEEESSVDNAEGKPFHFKYDEDSEKYGAGTAFLFEPDEE